jgi:hypothetical protein
MIGSVQQTAKEASGDFVNFSGRQFAVTAEFLNERIAAHYACSYFDESVSAAARMSS